MIVRELMKLLLDMDMDAEVKVAAPDVGDGEDGTLAPDPFPIMSVGDDEIGDIIIIPDYPLPAEPPIEESDNNA